MASKKPQLGAETAYPESYDPELLVSISRAEGRSGLILGSPMYGVDIWTGYELSWLDARGKPRMAIAEFRIACDSQCIVESKSFKLYLNSLNQEKFHTEDALIIRLREDLSKGFGGDVEVILYSLSSAPSLEVSTFGGDCLDELEIECNAYTPDAGLLLASSEGSVEEILHSHLLKTNCPVTGQPDWASVQVAYRGPKIDRAGLLQYLVSFRQHQDFHENCVETIFNDILLRCQPDELSVYARYTRRGGLDINPYRSTYQGRPQPCRLVRQ